MIDDVRRRAWRAYADARRRLTGAGSAERALAAVDAGDRRDVDSWTGHLDERHDAYRRSIEPASGTTAVLCVSARPHLLASVVESVARQLQRPTEFVLVTNDARYDDVDVEAAFGPLDGVVTTVLRRHPSRSLGSCLNDALAATDSRFVAKFDDDDHYGPHYLADALRAHSYAGAGVVGKHTYYAHLLATDEYVLRFPGHEFSYSSTLAGGTLVIDRERTGGLQFEDRSLGEDRAYIAACHRLGVSTFSADRFGFVQVRASDNTWAVSRDHFLAGCVTLARADGEGALAR